MRAYGEVAVAAVALCVKTGKDPRTAWNAAAKQQFPRSSSMQAKGCPRGAFIGLCAADMVRGVRVQEMTVRLGKNARYAVDAAKILCEKKPIEPTAQELWRKVGGGKAHNGQMDVVLALWSNRLIEGS